MQGLDQFDGDSSDTVFRDVIMLALAGFVAVVLLLLPHLNPPAKADDESSSPGNVIVEIRWPDDIDADVDLWVQAPGGSPVGYSNKGDATFNLLRDDLGKKGDFTDMNYEVSFSRGIPAGGYTVNLHLYSNAAKVYPVPVAVVVSLKRRPEESAKQLLSKKVTLTRLGEELTVFRFELSEEGRLVPGSVHDTPKALRGGAS
ncbi:MAG: hypothetical protein ACFCUQ_06755 [Kiloniellales bacterium]